MTEAATERAGLNAEGRAYIRKMTHPIYFRMGMLLKLPSAAFWRLKVKSLSSEKCQITIPYAWRTQNPFKSIYFAAMAGAAELSTGALCQLGMAGKGRFSMLVVDFRAEYFKKADRKITFTCNQGMELIKLVDSLGVGDSDKLTMVSAGTNPEGEEVAKFFVTWSVKRKS